MLNERPRRHRGRTAFIPDWILFHRDLTHDDVRIFAILSLGDMVTEVVAERLGWPEAAVMRCISHLHHVGALQFATEVAEETGQPEAVVALVYDDPDSAQKQSS